MTQTQNYSSIQVIWDHDHGTANEGWYLRTRDQEGREEDAVIDGLNDLAHDASDMDLRDAAIDFLFDSITDDESAALHCGIDVRR